MWCCHDVCDLHHGSLLENAFSFPHNHCWCRTLGLGTSNFLFSAAVFWYFQFASARRSLETTSCFCFGFFVVSIVSESPFWFFNGIALKSKLKDPWWHPLQIKILNALNYGERNMHSKQARSYVFWSSAGHQCKIGVLACSTTLMPCSTILSWISFIYCGIPCHALTLQ